MARTNLVVMAAGIGSRYGGLKQIDPITDDGDIIVDYALYDSIRAGFDKVIFVIRKDIEDAIRGKFSETVERRIETEYVLQDLADIPDGFEVPTGRTKPWGTAHALLAARRAVDAPFAAINADDFYGAGSYAILHDYLAGARDRNGVGDYCMVGFVLRNTLTEHGHVARGVCAETEDVYLSEIVERTMIRKFGEEARFSEDGGKTWTDVSMDALVSMNMWGFTPGVMAQFKKRFPAFLRANIANPKAEFLAPTIVNDCVQEGKATVKVLSSAERWFGVTYREDMPDVKAAIRKLIADGVYPEDLWG